MNEVSEIKEINLKTFCIVFEEALFKDYLNKFSNPNNSLQHIGCYFHYL